VVSCKSLGAIPPLSSGSVANVYRESSPCLGAAEGDLGALITFGDRCHADVSDDRIRTGLDLLWPEAVSEELRVFGAGPAQRQGELLYWAGVQNAVFAIWVNEASHGGIEAATRHAYQQLLPAIMGEGFPHMVRVWNYLADINSQDQGLERYRAFCKGRYQAFSDRGVSPSGFPSACALGHGGGDLLVYLLASKYAPVHFENPAQVSAYHYPERYGPRSPSFARGSLLSCPGCGPQLFVSGTASIVGHETRHEGDLVGQVRVTLANLDHLVAHVCANSDLGEPLVPQLLKIYLRHPEHLHLVRASVDQHFGGVPAVYVQAEICRRELLLEIEGIWSVSGHE